MLGTEAICDGTWETEADVSNQKGMTIILKALSLPKCGGFIRLNPNVFVGYFCKLAACFSSTSCHDDGKCLLNSRFNEFKSVFNTARIK